VERKGRSGGRRLKALLIDSRLPVIYLPSIINKILQFLMGEGREGQGGVMANPGCCCYCCFNFFSLYLLDVCVLICLKLRCEQPLN